MAPFRLLSIDGGGIRGIIPARILAEIEERARKPICSLFDVVAGTSTGGILALGLTLGEKGQPRFSARQLIDLYRENGASIFCKARQWEILDSITTAIPFAAQLGDKLGIPYDEDIHDLFRPKYRPTGREEVLGRYFGAARVRDALTRVFVPSYDTDLRVPVFFDSAAEVDDVYFDQLRDVSVLDAAMATSAAPTYFPPHRLQAHRVLSLVDGGVFANDPVALAYAFTRSADAEQEIVLSIGTGSMTQRYGFEEIEHWGAIRWASPALYMMMDGQSEAAALVMHRLLQARDATFFRWQALLSDAGVPQDMDDARLETIDRILGLAEKLVKDRSDEIDRLCGLLRA